MSLIRLENVSKFYKSVETVSVGMQKVNLEFNIGEFVAVTGESGSGKSTLLNVISGLDGYEEGELYLFDEETSHYNILDWEKYRSAYVGFVFQNYNIIDSYTVYQNVLLALEVQGYNPEKRKERALQLIRQVGLESHKNHKASKLSGGQKQRTVIARALAKDCPIIVADEPTGNLDSKSAEQIMELLHNISQDKLVIVVTHDYDQVKNYATRKIKMHDGEVVEDKTFSSPAASSIIETPNPKSLSFFSILNFSLRNLFSAPKRTIFLLMLQLIVMLSFMFLYSVIQYNIQYDYYYGGSTFNVNVPETRLLVEHKDGTDLTEEDYQYLLSLNKVTELYEYGINFNNSTSLYVFDITHPIQTSYNPGYYYNNFSLNATDAASTLTQFEYTGTMPVAENEIIIDDPYGQISIGDLIYLSKVSSYSANELSTDTTYFVVTGITKSLQSTASDEGRVFYSDAYLNVEQESREVFDQDKYDRLMDELSYNITFEYSTLTNYSLYINYVVDDGSTDNKLIFQSDYVYPDFSGTPISTESITFNVYIYDYDGSSVRQYNFDVTIDDILIYKDGTEYYMASINQYLFDQIKAAADPYITAYSTEVIRDNVSISVNSLSDGIKVIKQIDSEKYRVYYPSYIPTVTDPSELITKIVLNIILFFFGLMLYSIVHAASKNMMQSRNKDFAIFRSIGTSKQTLAHVVMMEQIIITVLSAGLMLIATYLIAYFVPIIREMLSVLTFMNYLYLFLVFLLFGVWLANRFNKKIFKQSVIQSITQSKEA